MQVKQSSDMQETSKSRISGARSKGRQAISEQAEKPKGSSAAILDRMKSNLNINIYEAKVWTALLSRGIATASQLADISGVPRSRCYDVLETLEKEGFIITKLGKPIRYMSVPPEEVIRRQKKEINKEAERKIMFIDSIKETDTFKELELLHRSGIEKVSIEDISTAIRGKSELRRHMKDMIHRAKKNITIVTTQRGFPRCMGLLKGIKQNGVRIEVGVPLDAAKIKTNNGIKIRQIDFNARLMSIDGERALLMINDDNIHPDQDSAILVKSEFFTSALDSFIRANMR